MTTPPSNLPFEPGTPPAPPAPPRPPAPPAMPSVPVQPPAPPMPPGEILAMPPRAPSGAVGKGGPEDIFSGLDQPKRPMSPGGAPELSTPRASSAGTYVGIFLGV